jgi:thiamine biosynthesis lipoprotein
VCFTGIRLLRVMSTEERVVDVMGTIAHLIVTDGSCGLADLAVERLHELEARWSRFRPDSEISRLNERSGVPVVVSPDTFTLVERAVAGWRTTGGLFDPTLLPELRDAGYDRSFELLGAGVASGPAAAAGSPARSTRRASPSPHRNAVDTITLDPVVRSIRVEAGVEIDPGGIGKGLAADMVVDLLLSRGARGALVSVGGDLRADGDAPERDGWVVAVADPSEPDRTIATLAIARGAVASTWRTKRTWTVESEARHHVIDPRTGAPAATGLTGVTVVSDRGWRAEVLAKAAFLAGRELTARLLGAHLAAGIVIADDGSVREVGDLAPFKV